MSRRRKTLLLFLALCLAFWAASASLQYLGGAFHNEFGGHPDEAAHYVTGLMVLEYVKHGLPANPMAFARDYYDHYPKVALGHYPPGFYILSTIWTSLFSPARTSVFLFLSLLAAATAAAAAVAGVKPLGTGLSILAGVLFLLLPLVQQYTSILMSDMAVALTCLLATLAFSRYLETEDWKSAVAFGLFASAAIMTKASGLLLALVPPFAIALSLKWHILRRISLWMSGLLVALLCLPWMLLTFKTSSSGMVYEPGIAYTRDALFYFPSQLVRTIGWSLAIPAAFAIGTLLVPLARHRRGLSPFWASMVSLPLALIFFYSLVPIDMDRRYLIPALLPTILLAALGVKSGAASLTSGRGAASARTATAMLSFVVVIVFSLEKFEIPRKSFAGFSPAVEFILSSDDSIPGRILISSDASGEGAFIAEFALRHASPPTTILRASKTLSSSNWIGAGYELTFDSADEVLDFLREKSIHWVVVDRSMPSHHLKAHHRLLDSTVKDASNVFTRAVTLDVERQSEHAPSALLLYRADHVSRP